MWPELLRLLENRDNPDQTVETDVRAMLDAVRKHFTALFQPDWCA